MGAVPQAKTCYYKGIEFKSNLEGKTAQALDNLGIRWEYERYMFRSSEFPYQQYTPDFYLPECNTYIECTYKWDQSHSTNARIMLTMHSSWDWTDPETEFPLKTYCRFLHVDNNGFFYGVDRAGKLVGNIALVRCLLCGKPWFMNELGTWQCPHCGAYDGGHYVNWIAYAANHNLFDAAGVKRYGGPR